MSFLNSIVTRYILINIVLIKLYNFVRWALFDISLLILLFLETQLTYNHYFYSYFSFLLFIFFITFPLNIYLKNQAKFLFFLKLYFYFLKIFLEFKCFFLRSRKTFKNKLGRSKHNFQKQSTENKILIDQSLNVWFPFLFNFVTLKLSLFITHF